VDTLISEGTPDQKAHENRQPRNFPTERRRQAITGDAEKAEILNRQFQSAFSTKKKKRGICNKVPHVSA